ncbi:unnamed protein product, partial [marine sediment metagenome]
MKREELEKRMISKVNLHTYRSKHTRWCIVNIDILFTIIGCDLPRCLGKWWFMGLSRVGASAQFYRGDIDSFIGEVDTTVQIGGLIDP